MHLNKPSSTHHFKCHEIYRCSHSRGAGFAGSAAELTKRGAILFLQKAVVCFVAGIELIDNARNLDDTTKAKKYKQLCSLTGLNAASASKIIEHYKDRPEEWQTVETSVIEMLQSNK